MYHNFIEQESTRYPSISTAMCVAQQENSEKDMMIYNRTHTGALKKDVNIQ